MKTINIAHLYYDLMNLYGENGNIRFISDALKEQGFKVNLDKLSINNKIDFSKYDFVYIGSGNEENQKIVLEDIKKYHDDILKYINDKKVFLATGNSIELFGNVIFEEEDTGLKPYEGLNIFNYHAPLNQTRIVGEQLYESKLIDKKIIGFQNRIHVIVGCNDNLFKVIQGNGYTSNSNVEGINKNNFYGTYLLGPILVRNPYFNDYLVKTICKLKNVKYQKPDYNKSCYLAYNKYLENFYSEKSTD